MAGILYKGNMLTGNLISYSGKNGYGFIRQDAGGADVYVSRNVLEACGITDPVIGDRLEFDVELDHRCRARATRVGRIERAPDNTYTTRVMMPRRRDAITRTSGEW